MNFIAEEIKLFSDKKNKVNIEKNKSNMSNEKNEKLKNNKPESSKNLENVNANNDYFFFNKIKLINKESSLNKSSLDIYPINANKALINPSKEFNEIIRSFSIIAVSFNRKDEANLNNSYLISRNTDDSESNYKNTNFPNTQELPKTQTNKLKKSNFNKNNLLLITSNFNLDNKNDMRSI